jgi:hypothetical protein
MTLRSKLKKQARLSNVVPVEERIVKVRTAINDRRPDAFHRRGTTGWLFPEFTMAQNLIDYLRLFDKRNNLHLAPALRFRSVQAWGIGADRLTSSLRLWASSSARFWSYEGCRNHRLPFI